MRVLVRQGRSILADLTFEETAVRIGSAEDAEVYLADAKIADYHVRLVPARQGKWSVEVVKHKPQAKLNDVLIHDGMNIRDGDSISLRDYVLTVYPSWDAGREESERLATEAEIAAVRAKPLPAGTLVKRHVEKVAIPAGWLDTISRIAMELSLCGDLRILMDYSLNMMLGVFGAGFAWMGARRRPAGRLEFVEGRLASGHNCDMPAFADAIVHHCVTRSQHICVPSSYDPEIVSAMATPLIAPEGNIGVVYVDTRKQGQAYKPHHLDLFSLISSHVSARLDQIIRGQKQLQATLAGGEISLAREVQARLDPRSIPQPEGLQIVAHCKPGRERSGDVLDVVRMASGAVAFFLGRVRAAGIGTGIMMAEARAAFRVAMLHGDAPHVFLRALNWFVHDQVGQGTVDCVCVILDPGSGSLKYSDAGRSAAVILSNRGEPVPLTASGAPAVGAERAAEYQTRNESLHPGSSLALMTPGLAEAENVNGEKLPEQRFIDALCDGFGQSARAALDDALVDVEAYLKHGKQPEDVSILFIRRN